MSDLEQRIRSFELALQYGKGHTCLGDVISSANAIHKFLADQEPKATAPAEPDHEKCGLANFPIELSADAIRDSLNSGRLSNRQASYLLKYMTTEHIGDFIIDNPGIAGPLMVYMDPSK